MSALEPGQPLSEQECMEFRSKGYVTVDSLVTDEMLSGAGEASQELWAKGSGAFGRCVIECGRQSRGLDRAFNAQVELPALSEILHSLGIGRCAAQLLGCAAVRLWYSQLIAKYPASAGKVALDGAVGWHQDYAYWRCCRPADMLTAWIPFQAVSRDSGSLRFVTGSHLLSVEEPLKGFNKEISYENSLLHSPDVPRLSEEVVQLVPGQVSFHHCMTLHSSGPNRSESPRLAFAIHLMATDVRVYASPDCHHSLEFLWPEGLSTTAFPDEERWPIIR